MSYCYSEEYLHCYFRLIDLNIRYHIELKRLSEKSSNDYAGLTISEEEVNELLRKNDQINFAEDQINNIRKEFNEGKRVIYDQLCEIQKRAEQNSKEIKLCRLKDIFNLTSAQTESLLIALAPELDSKYEKFFSYLQNDVTRKLPTIELIATLLEEYNSEPESLRVLFYADSLFRKFYLIHIHTDIHRVYTPNISQYVRVDDRIVRYIFGNDSPDEMIQRYITVNDPEIQSKIAGFDQGMESEIERIRELFDDNPVGVVYLEGAIQSDKEGTAYVLSRYWNRKIVKVVNDPFNEGMDHDAVILRILREALLLNATIYFEKWIQKYVENDSPVIKRILDTVQLVGCIAFMQGEQSWEAGMMVNKGTFARIKLPASPGNIQISQWKMALNGYALELGEGELAHIQSTFRLSRTQIFDAACTARRIAERRSAETKVHYSDIYTACRIHSAGRMGYMARKVKTMHEWEDIVLPREKINQLREICSCIQHRSQVFGEWGFENKLSLGKGISALFSGVSGTGKTMAAEIIANTLKVDLFKIDLSSVVSKYIGETEKNLSRIFDEAENNNAILFFDEADAIMGKRSEVKDAHDRYSNIETAYLLQRMEEYSGISLLATNFRQNIDTAFVRRIRYIVEFPFPDPKMRKRIWEKIWGCNVPLSSSIDFDFIAYQFELSGGNIRNIALNSSFLAAEQNSSVAMQHILHAIRRELQKMGKVCVDKDFGKYQNLTADAEAVLQEA